MCFLAWWILKGCGHGLWHQRRSSAVRLVGVDRKDKVRGKLPSNESLKINCILLHSQLFLSIGCTEVWCPSRITFQSWTMNNFILLEEQLIKKSQQKRRTSPSNFKVRFFVLTKASLAYFEDRHGVWKHLLLSLFCVCIELICGINLNTWNISMLCLTTTKYSEIEAKSKRTENQVLGYFGSKIHRFNTRPFFFSSKLCLIYKHRNILWSEFCG